MTSACYKQHVCTYLQPFHTKWANSSKITLCLMGYPSLMPSFEGNPFPMRDKILSQKRPSPCGNLQWRFHDPSFHRFDRAQGCDRWTDRQTRQRWLRCVTLSRVKISYSATLTNDYARKQNASRVFAIVWASVRHTRDLYQNGVS